MDLGMDKAMWIATIVIWTLVIGLFGYCVWYESRKPPKDGSGDRRRKGEIRRREDGGLKTEDENGKLREEEEKLKRDG
jgi:hypothetical protein